MILAMFLFSSVAFAQQTFTFSSDPADIAIPDDGYDGTLGSMASDAIVASGIPAGTVTNIEIDVAITHTWIGDLTVKLVSPDGTILGVLSRPGLADVGDNGADCCGRSNDWSGATITFSDAGSVDAENMGLTAGVICSGNGECSYFPNPGSIATPPSTFTELYTGLMNGTWTIYVSDAAGLDIGTLNSWTLRISEVFDCSSGIGCQAPNQVNAYVADLSFPQQVGENFVPQTSGPITSVCWYGVYYDFASDCGPGSGDDFTITYYNDNAGAPGTILAGPLAVSPTVLPTGGILAGSLTEYGYEATHAPVSVIAFQAYWIEITNNLNGTCVWFWETAGPGDGISYYFNGASYNASDLAFCLNVPINADGGLSAAPVNDVCSQAIATSCGSTVFGTTTNATTQDNPGTCTYDLSTAGGVWYSFVGTGEQTTVSLGGAGTDYDTKLGVFTGSCGSLTCVAGDDDSGPGLTSQLTFCATLGTTYYIYNRF